MDNNSYISFLHKKMLEKLDSDLADWYLMYEELTSKKDRNLIENFSDWRTAEANYAKAAEKYFKNNSNKQKQIMRIESVRMNIGHLNEKRNEIDQYFNNNKTENHTSEILDLLLRKKWNPCCYPEIIWNDNQKILNELRTTVVIGIGINADSKRIAKEVAKNTGEDIKKCELYVSGIRNEFISEQQIVSYQEFKIKKYSILIAYDTKTCEKCQKMDEQIFNVKDAIIGVNFPPFHPGCRCTTVPHSDSEFSRLLPEGEKAARDRRGRTIYIPESMTYKEWRKKYIGD